jgi:hypothetical protein
MRDEEIPVGLLDSAHAKTRCGWVLNAMHITTNNFRPAPIDGLNPGATVHDAVIGAFHPFQPNDFLAGRTPVVEHQV